MSDEKNGSSKTTLTDLKPTPRPQSTKSVNTQQAKTVLDILKTNDTPQRKFNELKGTRFNTFILNIDKLHSVRARPEQLVATQQAIFQYIKKTCKNIDKTGVKETTDLFTVLEFMIKKLDADKISFSEIFFSHVDSWKSDSLKNDYKLFMITFKDLMENKKSDTQIQKLKAKKLVLTPIKDKHLTSALSRHF